MSKEEGSPIVTRTLEGGSIDPPPPSSVRVTIFSSWLPGLKHLDLFHEMPVNAKPGYIVLISLFACCFPKT